MSEGLLLDVRDYGTRIYEQMYKVLDDHGEPWLEVRRLPKSTDIMPVNACHLRLTNRQCYAAGCVDRLRRFMDEHSVLFRKIYRVDVCLDFERFDYGDDPAKFLRRFVDGKYSKINQADITLHGEDTWNMRVWHSVSWGARKSQVSTKMYCKTIELQEVRDKPYIRYDWFRCGLVDDPGITIAGMRKRDGKGGTYQPAIWRVEFSIKADVRNWLTIEENGEHGKYRSIRNDLTMYDTKEKLLTIFASLTKHYFHFRKFQQGVVKYKCPEKLLFNFAEVAQFVSIEHPSTSAQPSTMEQRLLKLLQQYRSTTVEEAKRKAIDLIITTIEEHDAARLCPYQYSREQLIALQRAVAARMAGIDADIVTLTERYMNLIAEGVFV